MTDIFDSIGVETETLKETNNKLYNETKELGIDIKYSPNPNEDKKKGFTALTKEDREQAVIESIIPAAYKDADFDEEKIKNNIAAEYKRLNHLYEVHKFKEYIQLCNGIKASLQLREIPTRSYIIGAPNGFGKTSFVTECLIILRKNGFRVAPYITLSELNALRVEDERRMMSPFFAQLEKDDYNTKDNTIVYNYNSNKGVARTPKQVIGSFSYSEYINADCLFVALTSRNSKEVESFMLKQLLNIRAIKGLPTIVTMMESLDIYTKDPNLKKYVWDEILAYTERENCYDRLFHVSTYKIKKTSKLDENTESINKDTGIID